MNLTEFWKQLEVAFRGKRLEPELRPTYLKIMESWCLSGKDVEQLFLATVERLKYFPCLGEVREVATQIWGGDFDRWRRERAREERKLEEQLKRGMQTFKIGDEEDFREIDLTQPYVPLPTGAKHVGFICPELTSMVNIEEFEDRAQKWAGMKKPAKGGPPTNPAWSPAGTSGGNLEEAKVAGHRLG